MFPPIQGVCVYIVLLYAFAFTLGGNLARIFLCGVVFGYICYDMTHYYIHHGSPQSGHFLSMKSYHNKHHYKNGQKGFGITNKLWDYVYGTAIED